MNVSLSAVENVLGIAFTNCVDFVDEGRTRYVRIGGGVSGLEGDNDAILAPAQSQHLP
jgi:hypothetical protein